MYRLCLERVGRMRKVVLGLGGRRVGGGGGGKSQQFWEDEEDKGG